MHLAAGTRVAARYVVIGPLGEGGGGSVHRARDLVFDRDVALKVAPLAESAKARALHDELAALTSIAHPRIVEVFDVGHAWRAARPFVWLTTAIVDGVPLDRFAAERTWRDVRRAFADVLLALAHLHRAGIRHGDVKPANVCVDAAGRATLIDLGASGVLAEGLVSGTRDFLAPELLEGARPSARSDLYALGVTLGAITERLRGDDPEPIALATRLAARDPKDRPIDAREVLERLGFAREDDRPVVSSRLVGRDVELARFGDALSAWVASKPGPRVVWLRGPTGSGRSRLLRELKWTASRAPVDVVEGNALQTGAIAAMCTRALEADDAIGADVRALLDAKDAISRRARPTVLVLDDIERLSTTDRDGLDALVRTTSETDRLAIVLASTTPRSLPDGDTRMLAIDLAPLAADDVAAWLGDRVVARDVAALVRSSGGWPGDIVDHIDASRRKRDAATIDLDLLDARARAAIAIVLALDGVVSPSMELATGLTRSDLDTLIAHGLVRRDAGVLRLSRLGDAATLAKRLGDGAMRAAHDSIAAMDGLAPADRACHLAYAGKPDAAAAILRVSRDDTPSASSARRRAARALAERATDADTRLFAAELLDDGGDPRAALDVLARIARTRPPEDVRARVHLRAASCRLRLGDGRAVLHAVARHDRLVSRASITPVDRATSARAVDLACRAYIQLGRHADAAERARDLLVTREVADLPHVLLAAIHEDLGVAASYLGDAVTARDHLERAERLSAHEHDPRALVRTLSYRAIHEYRIGALGAAAAAYRRALAIAETHHLSDQIASAALNLGTVLHRRGSFAEALARYEDALRLAVALGKLRTELAARLDLGQLAADLHQLDRAREHASRVGSIARAEEQPFFAATSDMLAGEIALHAGEVGRANASFSRAIEAFAALSATRERADVHLLEAELALSVSPPAMRDATTALGHARDAIREASAHDLEPREALMTARIALAKGDVASAITRLEDAARRAHDAEQRDLEAELEAWLARALERDGAIHAANARRAHALATWDHAAAGLSPAMRERFASHPRRRIALEPIAPAHDAPMPTTPLDAQARPSSARDSKLARLVRINARLSARLRADDVLEDTMDAAIDLTGAERGFLLLGSARDRGPRGHERMHVAVARNLDRESIRRSAMKFSRTIAERVIASGEPILTSEALSDERFSGQRSVQAMQLQSVLCVPLRAGEETLGAIYVDNRFQRGRFDASDLEALVGLATQVAIALTNARLHADLDARTRELETERARIAELLAEKERELDRLAEQVRAGAVAPQPERTGSFAGIVGRSAGMRTLLAALERVIDSSATVLVMGESGTGKELVARALHREGPRRDAPYVTVNCAALPETLLESELFGHVRGAFTGADQDRAGLFARAGRGTLFLDEIGELPLGMQAKLLRALQEREVRPLGSAKSVPVFARIVCATNRDLESEIDAGRFRRDLYYRLAVVELVLPPLRERLDDLPELARHLLDHLARDHGRVPAPSLTPAALRRLVGHRWPGNVRELENVLSRALLFTRGDTVGADDLVLPASASTASRRASHRDYRLREAARIASALEEHRWNVTEVARVLGIPRTSLYRKLREHGLGRTRT